MRRQRAAAAVPRQRRGSPSAGRGAEDGVTGARHGAALDALGETLLVLDEHGAVMSAAPGASVLQGEALSEPFVRLPGVVHVEDRKRVISWLSKLRRVPGPSAPLVVRAAGPDASWAFLELGGHNLLAAAAPAMVLTVRDVTARRILEERLHALERSYAVLAATDDAILERVTPEELFTRVGEVALRLGCFSMAWLGAVEDDVVRPLAVVGAHQPYVESVQSSVDERSERSRGPTGTAVRLRRTVICPDIQGDPNMQPWRHIAEGYGYRSSVAVPVLAHDRVVGVLNGYAEQTDAFDAATTELLERVAVNLGRTWERDHDVPAQAAGVSSGVPGPTHAEPGRPSPHLDSTTGLTNRAGAQVLLTDTIGALEVGQQLHVLLIDVDGFSRLNDLYGERIGDDVLRGVVARLQHVMSAQDVLARLDSNEFLLGLVGGATCDPEGVAMQILDTFRSPMRVGESIRTVRVSLGIATRTSSSMTAAELVRDAGVALRRAKGRGTGQLSIYDDAARAFIRRRREIEEGLEHAAARGELVVRYQPVVELTTGRIVGAEALVRWDHPVLGFLPPNDFIDVAEETGHIVDIGRFVIREAARTSAAWRRALGRGIHVAVNVSGRQFVDEGLVEAVDRALSQTGARAEDLVIEVTESALAQDVEHARLALSALRQLGVRVAVDDFGTGYSSLAQLRQLPVDVIKIDRSFVSGILDQPRDAAMVAAIARMGGALELEVVAEGIERQEQVPVLASMGCGFGQGYLWSRPVGADAVLAMLTREATR